MTTAPLSITARVEMWAMDLVDALEADYNKSYPNSSDPVKFETKMGRKYIKIIHQDFDTFQGRNEYKDGSVHAFVNKKTGEVYKPASWKSPHTKYVRFDLRIISDREKLHDYRFTDWAGGYLYLR